MTKNSTLAFATAWAFLVVFAIHFLDFPGSVPRFLELSNGGILLDQVPSFTVEATYQRLSDYEEEGRKSYAFRNLTVDILLPLSVLPFLFVLMLRAVTSLQLNRSLRVLLISLPFTYVIFDFAENVAVLVLLNNYPQRMHLLAGILPYVTSVKRAASLLALFVPLVIMGVRFLLSRINRRGGR
ncbi:MULTISPECIES: hypothetical protein [Adhaeribacter]|uniref:Uncharacterized protein n=1 Tax=Adhaeribacter rhizoryzae TaxID=2607907 RepID=A0A5M6D3K0_9BACT|nr:MULTISPECIES: hypothetical protein [Adhaeribacter]KAA5542054.1 hypothetical protein F0145_19905 [Adhaeribacter rhizoryzae]